MGASPSTNHCVLTIAILPCRETWRSSEPLTGVPVVMEPTRNYPRESGSSTSFAPVDCGQHDASYSQFD